MHQALDARGGPKGLRLRMVSGVLTAILLLAVPAFAFSFADFTAFTASTPQGDPATAVGFFDTTSATAQSTSANAASSVAAPDRSSVALLSNWKYTDTKNKNTKATKKTKATKHKSTKSH